MIKLNNTIRTTVYSVLTISPKQVYLFTTVDRDKATWSACRAKCGKIFNEDLSDDAQYACIIGCCPTVLRSLSHQGKCLLHRKRWLSVKATLVSNMDLVHSEVWQEEEEERVFADAKTMKEHKKKFPKTFAWNNCVTTIAKTPSNQFYGTVECCKTPPV